MPKRDILLLGNPLLYKRSTSYDESERDSALITAADMIDTINAFNQEHSWGRAMAAPQIGIHRRLVCVGGEAPRVFINPVLSEMSPELIEIWDDCMSFPDMLVRIRRHVSCTLTYQDEKWNVLTERLEGSMSELMQHEVDHLDGILSVMRAIDGRSFALQSERKFLEKGAFANRRT